MFANFLYLLVALLVYTTCQYPKEAVLPDHALLMAAGLLLGFTLICRKTFERVGKKASAHPFQGIDIPLDRALVRLSILALLLFAVDLYVLRLKLIFSGAAIFTTIPTFKAALFLCFFILHLVIIWALAWDLQRRFISGTVSRKEFVLSNISFSLPALIPWLLLSLTSDLIMILPFEGPRKFLSSSVGEIVFVLVFLFAVAAFGPLLIQKMWRCTPLEPGPVRQRIEYLLRRSGMNYAEILKWELFGGGMITAGVMGLVARFRYILVTPALLRALTFEEMDAVIAHEIGHVQRKHIHFYLIFFAGFIACLYALLFPFLDPLYYTSVLLGISGYLGFDVETAANVVLNVILIGLFLLYFRYVFGYFMRNFERQADIHVYSLLGDARAIIQTFFKIARFSRQSPDKPNWHHFSIAERIGFLQRCEQDPTLIQAHHRKVRGMILGYFLALALVCCGGYFLNAGPGKAWLDRQALETLMKWDLQIKPEHSDFYVMVGDYFLTEQDYEKTVQAYRNALAVNPDNVYALNNLAWVYATCEDRAFRNYPESLSLAGRALAVDRAAYVLDTYAEACFVNKRFDEALAASLEALNKAEDRLDYYAGQVERFRRHVDSDNV